MIRLALKKSFNNWVEMGDGIRFRLDYPTQEQEQKLQDILLRSKEFDTESMVKYQRYFIKCTVKDWQGLDEKCELRNNELKDDLWWALVSELQQATDIYAKVSKELEFNSTDKKKLESAETFGAREN